MDDDRVLVVSDVEAEQLRLMPYAEYLETEHWKVTRGLVAAHRGNRCDLCGTKLSDGQGECHHKTYKRRGVEKYSDLSLLCRSCHALYHQVKE